MTVHEFEKRRRVVEVPEPDAFACPRCGEQVDAYATRCRACGVHFAGPAFHIATRAYAPPTQGKRFLKWVLLLFALIAAVVTLAM